MTEISRMVWGREFTLEVVYDCYEGEGILPSQQEALANIENSWDVINDCLPEVRKRCVEDSEGQLSAGDIGNIFHYVIPEQLYITRDEKHRGVALLCAYRLDEEHGLAVVFRDEEFAEIGPQDIVL